MTPTSAFALLSADGGFPAELPAELRRMVAVIAAPPPPTADLDAIVDVHWCSMGCGAQRPENARLWCVCSVCMLYIRVCYTHSSYLHFGVIPKPACCCTPHPPPLPSEPIAPILGTFCLVCGQCQGEGVTYRCWTCDAEAFFCSKHVKQSVLTCSCVSHDGDRSRWAPASPSYD